MTKVMRHDKPQQINDPAANYIGRVNRAMDYIVANLGQSLNLDEVSRQAGFSPFHFHRVLKALVGETLNNSSSASGLSERCT
jgi:AraC-like DNA-binding protein